MKKEYIDRYLNETALIIEQIDRDEIVKGIAILEEIRKNEGRLFILGVGGSAANASHAVNDFRKIGGIECYAPTDNVAELTARTNDEGWETTFSEWLRISKICGNDAILVLSVGGGSETTSLNIVNALKLGKEKGAKVISIVSRTGGYSKEVSDVCVLVPMVSEERITPHAEGWQGIIWHLLVNAISGQKKGNMDRKMRIEDLRIAIYADGADIHEMMEMARKDFIKGFTTNPELMKKAGVTSYTEFAQSVTGAIPDKPVSFEVFADDFASMEREAHILAGYGENVFIKIPITNTKGESSVPLIARLSRAGLNLNITAVFTVKQTKAVLDVLERNTKNIISVFAGRIADTGTDPETVMREVASLCREKPGVMSLWASSREVFNIMQAERCGVDIITLTGDLLSRLGNVGKSLEQFSLETVQMFAKSGEELGFSIT